MADDDDAWALFADDEGGKDEEQSTAEGVVEVGASHEEAYRGVQRFVHLNLGRACNEVRTQLGQEQRKLADASAVAFGAYCTSRLAACRESARTVVAAAWELHKQRRWGNICVREVFLMNQLMNCMCDIALFAKDGPEQTLALGTWREEMTIGSSGGRSACDGGGRECSAIDSIIQRLDLAVILGAPGEVVLPLLEAAEALRSEQGPADDWEGRNATFADTPRLCKDWIVEKPIERRKEALLPSLEEFRAKHYEGDAPVVLEGLMQLDGWDAPEQWKSLSFWEASLGHRLLPMEVGTMVAEVAALGESEEKATAVKEEGKKAWYEDLLTGREFLRQFIHPSILASSQEKEGAWDDAPVGYMAQHPLCEQVASLKDSFKVPRYCSVGSQQDKNINVWFGTHGTVTSLHYDSYDNLLSQAVGWKYVRLYAPKETDKLYPVAVAKSGRSGIAAQQNISRVHVGSPDHAQFPLFSTAEYQETVLAPGDILYIPTGWWHYVESLSPSVSINFWF